MTMVMDDVVAREARHVLQTYRRNPVTFARRYWYTKGEPRSEIIALEESFHGRTFGSLSVTSDEHYRAPFAPLLAGVTFVPVNDPDALARVVTAKTAAIIAEPVQGEGGV